MKVALAAIVTTVAIYDVPHEKNKALVELSCENKTYKLLLNKEDLSNERAYKTIERWALDMRVRCELERGNVE